MPERLRWRKRCGNGSLTSLSCRSGYASERLLRGAGEIAAGSARRAVVLLAGLIALGVLFCERTGLSARDQADA